MFKTEKELRVYLEDVGCDEETVIFTNPSYLTAFVGLSHDNKAIYDMDLMVDYLMNEDNMEEIDAIEFIEYNTIRSLPYQDNAPIIVNLINKEN